MNKVDKRMCFFQQFEKSMLKFRKAFLLCIVLLIAQSNIGIYAQDARVSIKEKQTSIKNVLKKIESQSDYTFFYNDADTNFNQQVDVDADNESVKSILSRILPNFTFKVENKKVILVLDKAKTGVASGSSSSKTKTISGTVTDINNEPLIGISIRLQSNMTVGTITDLDGNFTLNNMPDQGSILLTSIGFADQVVPLRGKTEFNIILEEDANELNEVVFVGYGVQKKINLSGAVDGVSVAKLKDRPVTNLGTALQGVIANLNVTPSSGQATSTPALNIRGMTSINGGSPLIVIDGVAASNTDLNNLNSVDIESMTIMKDAASAAIYGSRAAFGVILINTKNGARGGDKKVKVNYNNNFSFSVLATKPDIITDPATVVDMKNIYAYPWYNLYDENEIAYAKRRSADPSLPEAYVDSNGNWKYFGNTDWFKEGYRDASFSNSHSIDVSGGTDRMAYYFSGGYMRKDGMLRKNNDIYNRYNLRSKLDFKVTDWWSIGNNTSYTTADYDEPTYLGWDYYWALARTNPLAIPKNPDGSWTDAGVSKLGIIQEGGRANRLESNFNTQFSTELTFVKNVWTANGNFSLGRSERNYDYNSLSVNYKNSPKEDEIVYNTPTYAREWYEHSDRIIFDAYTTFNKTFFEKHYFSAMVGYNQEEYKLKNINAQRDDLISENVPHVNLATGKMNMSGARSSYALRSFLFRVNYIFDEKYVFETNGRYDGTSRFPKDDRFVFNPSASLAWIVSKEKFFESVLPVVSHLKLRASYGTLGNQDVSDYKYIATMGHGKTSPILNGLQPTYVGAPGLVSSSLTWEQVHTKNFGFDINFLRNRLTLSTDIYQRDTKDMLTAGKPLPPVLGTGVPTENAADLRVKGWEFTLNWKDQFTLSGKPFVYNLSFNLADNQAEITKFDNPTGTLDSYYKGQKIGEMWGMTTLGYFTSEEDIKNHPNQTIVTAYPGMFDLAPGDLKFENRNGDDAIDWGKWTVDDHGDFHVIGNDRARYTFGLGGNAEWNNIDFSFFIQGVGKKDYYPGSGDLMFWGVNSQPWTNVTKKNMDYWTPENPNAYFPRRKAYVADKSFRELGAVQTKYMQNAAYARLKNLTVGYTLPQKWINKASLSRLRVFFSGENLMEVSGLDDHYKVDPDGLGGLMYPLQRSFSFGLNASF